MKNILCVGIVVFDKGNVLLVRSGPASHHFDGTYGLPSGKLEPEETNEQAAVRELFEETGLSAEEGALSPIKLFTAVIEQKHGTFNFIWQTFLCKSCSGKLKATDETKPEWVPIEKLRTLKNLLPNIENAVKLALKQIPKA